VPDGVGWILRSAAATQPPVHEHLKQIEGERPKKQDGTQGILRMPKDVPEIPVADPLMESGVFDMPTGPDNL
jgi:hypothetical protein